MPGFGNNTQNAIGGAINPTAQGTTRFSLSQATSSFLPVVVTSGTTATQAISIHSSSLSAMDELYLWAVNNGASDAFLSISFTDDRDGAGEFAAFKPDPVITKLSPSGGATLIWPGIPILSLNETSPTVVYGSGTAGSNISVHGYVMRRNRVNATDANQGYDGTE
jgi:hypothetical protein